MVDGYASRRWWNVKNHGSKPYHVEAIEQDFHDFSEELNRLSEKIFSSDPELLADAQLAIHDAEEAFERYRREPALYGFDKLYQKLLGAFETTFFQSTLSANEARPRLPGSVDEEDADLGISGLQKQVQELEGVYALMMDHSSREQAASQIAWVKERLRFLIERHNIPEEMAFLERDISLAEERRDEMQEKDFQEMERRIERLATIIPESKWRTTLARLQKRFLAIRGFDRFQDAAIRHDRQGDFASQRAWAYQTLGIDMLADAKAAKLAYYSLVRQHHPDLFKAGTEEYRQAQQRTRRIIDAYHFLKKYMFGEGVLS